ncbi:VMAP-C domain-containing protein [Nostoc sp.]|uniref:VMAP-C domain-containing protein n=1 Tax=Nostoc sp. TaxID=1180 RepID=UPI002FFA8363
MTHNEHLKQVLNRVEKGQQTDEDITVLHQKLQSGDRQIASQLGKYNVNIGEAREIYIGDRIYNQWDKEAMEALVKAIQEASGIHQNTQGGDAAARDIDKRNIYENCTFIQLLAKDSNLGNLSQEPLKDLDFSDIPQESIRQAYQDALPPDASVWNLKGDNITQILQELNEFRRLFEFFNCLSQDESLPEEIRNKVSNFAKNIVSKKHPEENTNKSSKDFFSEKERLLESYLIATIERCDDDNEQFLLNAWLIIDDSVQVNDLSKFTSLLNKDEQQQGTLCKFNDIPKQLNKFLERSLIHLKNKKYQLIIEVFLPTDLMGTEVDRWKVPHPLLKETTLGIEYPIRLRSLERLDIQYLYRHLSDWYKSWDKVKKILHNEPSQELFEHLKEMENFNWKSLRINLKEKIGLKVTCAPPKAKTKELFKAILTATTPIAIWTRCDIPNFDHVAAIDEILTFKPLCHLCESVRLTREKADAQTEEHLGFHLALLWEDPHRLTPNVMLELTTPGQ